MALGRRSARGTHGSERVALWTRSRPPSNVQMHHIMPSRGHLGSLQFKSMTSNHSHLLGQLRPIRDRTSPRRDVGPAEPDLGLWQDQEDAEGRDSTRPASSGLLESPVDQRIPQSNKRNHAPFEPPRALPPPKLIPPKTKLAVGRRGPDGAAGSITPCLLAANL